MPGDVGLGPLPEETAALVVVMRRTVGAVPVAASRETLGSIDDWDAFLAAAQLHGLTGTACRVALRDVGDALPPAVARECSELRRQIARRSLLMSRQALRVMELLRDVGVPALLYKGPALSESIYGDVAARSWSDIDLIIAEDQLPAAWRALEGAGFEAHAGGVALGASLVGAEQELGFRHPALGLAVDLHWRVGLRLAGASVSGDELLARAGVCEVLGRAVPAPSRSDMALLAAVHAAAHNWPRLDHVLTMALSLAALGKAGSEGAVERCAAGLESRAATTGCARRLHVGVLLATAIAGAAPPAPLLRRARSDPAAARLAAGAGADLLWCAARAADHRAPRSHARGILWKLAAFDSVAAAAAHVGGRLLRPSTLDSALHSVWPAADRPRRCVAKFSAN